MSDALIVLAALAALEAGLRAWRHLHYPSFWLAKGVSKISILSWQTESP